MKKNSNAHFYSTLKPWVSQSIKLGRMKIENKKAKVNYKCNLFS